MSSAQTFSFKKDDVNITACPVDVVVVEEIEEDTNVSLLTHHSGSPTQQIDGCQNTPSAKPRREFGNISPISELLDDEDINVDAVGTPPYSNEEDNCEDGDSGGQGKFSPEPGYHPPGRASFPRISDGRSSPILAYSPSLVKSPSSGGSRNNANAPSSPTSTGVGKRTRNIARILENISDHSSGEDEVNHVNNMMQKFTV